MEFELNQFENISTHSLTKRLTEEQIRWYVFFCISTHSLTKRLTYSDYHQFDRSRYFNSQPHEEADGGAPDESRLAVGFQLTASRRG